MSRPIQKIAVIGAGAAGLCAAKHMLSIQKDVVIFEKGSFIGGLWVYRNDNGRSPAYRSLHINSEARVTGYRDFPLSEDVSLYPSHEEMRHYFEKYADQFGLRDRIRFNSEVTDVSPATDRGWALTLGDGTQEMFDAVIVANGHQAKPVHPAFSKDFTGDYLHALDYEVPEPFEGKTVLVIGAGNSALDIAADVSTTAHLTVLAARSPVLIMPRMFLGAPLSRFLAKVEKPWVPWAIRRRVREFVTWLVHGSMESWGLTSPKSQTHPASHPTIFARMAWGRVRAKPGVQSVEGKKVHFADGSSLEFDAMIAATGYEVDFDFLSGTVAPLEGHRINLYKRIIHPDFSGLFFVGLFDVSGGANIRMMDIQAKWLASVVAGLIDLPDKDRMIADYKAEQDRLAQIYPGTPRYSLELDPREYGISIREDMKLAKNKSLVSPGT